MKLKCSWLYILLVVTVLLQSCSTVEPFYSKSNRSWKQDFKEPGKEIAHTLYLIGDAGAPEKDGAKVNFPYLNKMLQGADSNTTVLFLGDNIYPRGLPKKNDETRKYAESCLDAQLDILKGYKGKSIFIPGNHDWDKGGDKGYSSVLRQEKYIESKLKQKHAFLPNSACPGPVEVKLGDDLVLIVIDTQWWLHPHARPGKEEHCDVDTELEFVAQFNDAVKRNKDKQIIVAGHHPLFSNGTHGGNYPLKAHIFPLTDLKKGLYIPMPLIGSIYPLYRSFIGNIQDIPHFKYQALKDAIMNGFEPTQDPIYVAGHEHNLQYHPVDGQHHIVSGSGSKVTYAKKGGTAAFAYQGAGYSKLIQYRNGAVVLEFWDPGKEDNAARVFRKVIRKGEMEKSSGSIEKQETIALGDSVQNIVPGEIYKAGPVKKLLLGAHYRDIWTTPANFPVLDLEKEAGGLIPIKKGGGMQTKSLRFQGGDGSQYVIRSIQKDPVSAVPKLLRKTFAKQIVQDGISASHPYGATVVPKLADAVQVLHSDPRMVYVPKSDLLGPYKEEFGDMLVLFERRPSGDQRSYAGFGNAKKIISTPKMLESMREDIHNRVDERAMLRARLFDMLLGDWDRHEDQWRWASYKRKHGHTYKPIPRDRDQVFHKFDGVFPSMANRRWAIRKLQTFDDDIRDIIGQNFNAMHVDRSFLTELSRDDWKEIADSMKLELTDEIIDEAFKNLPQGIKVPTVNDIVPKLKSRRDNLDYIADSYYKVLAKTVEVIGSNNADYFRVKRKNNTTTEVKVYEHKKKGKGKLVYKRSFDFPTTKEIRIYALDGDDEIEISGEVKSGPVIRIIGGEGDDEIKDNSKVSGLRKKTIIYEHGKGNKLYLASQTKDKSDEDGEHHHYNRKSFTYDQLLPQLYFGFNIDDGVFIGGGAKRIKHGFEKTPYKYSQKLVGNYAQATGAYSFKYEGDFTSVLGKWDLHLQAHRFAPNYIHNFFGLGNESKNENDDLNYYRMRYREFEIFPAIKRGRIDHDFVRIGPVYNRVHVLGTGKGREAELDSTANKFIVTPEAGLKASDFESKNYAGIRFVYSFHNYNHKFLPTRGVSFSVNSSLLDQLGGDNAYLNIRSRLNLIFPLRIWTKPIIALQLGGATNIGSYEFFQSNTLGGLKQMRGIRRDRYAGRTSFYQNTEVRLKLFNLRTYIIPVSVGVYGFNDIGRVWQDDEDSNKLHRGYGVGIWLSPLNRYVITSSFSVSDDDSLFNLQFGFFF